MSRTTLVNSRTPTASPDNQEQTTYTVMPPEVHAFISGTLLDTADMAVVYKYLADTGLTMGDLLPAPVQEPTPLADAPTARRRTLRKLKDEPSMRPHLEALCSILDDADKEALVLTLSSQLGYSVE